MCIRDRLHIVRNDDDGITILGLHGEFLDLRSRNGIERSRRLVHQQHLRDVYKRQTYDTTSDFALLSMVEAGLGVSIVHSLMRCV